MYYRLFFSLSFLTTLAFAQTDPVAVHQKACAGLVDCRINVIASDLGEIAGTCKGKLVGQFDCELKYFHKKGSNGGIKLFCHDQKKVTIVDQTIEASFISYQLAVITKLDGNETFAVDTKDYLNFDHPSLKLTLSKEKGKVEGAISLVMKEELVNFTNVVCE